MRRSTDWQNKSAKAGWASSMSPNRLKIIKPGMDTKQVIARFEAERQALAMMDHHLDASDFVSR